MPSHPDTGINQCRVCGVEIEQMAYKGEGFCGVTHKNNWLKENPTPLEIKVSSTDIEELLSSAGVSKKHSTEILARWEDLLVQKMPHLFRLVDTDGVESK